MKTKRNLFLILFISFAITMCSQTKKNIDSINNIPFAKKLEKAKTLNNLFLLNLKNAKKINYLLGEAESYSNLSLIYYYQGKYENDLQYSLKAILIFERLKNFEKLASEFAELGYRMKNRNLQKALFYMQKAKMIAEKKKIQKPLLSIYNNYGVLKEMQNQLDSALYFYQKGLVIKENIKDSVGIPYSLNNIANVHSIRKDYKKANVLYDKALSIRTKLKDEVGITENFCYFGDLLLAQNKYSEAIIWYEKAVEKSLKFGYIDITQYSFKKISQCYENLNNKEKAFLNYKKFVQYKDSLLNKETNSKIAELEIEFETAKKEKQLLQNEVEIKNSKNRLIATFALTILISLIGFLIYRQQKLKNKQQNQEFELKTAISKIETQNKLQDQRLTISRDLHDNIGAQLTFIISSVDNIKYAFDIQNSKLDDKLQKISSFTKDTIVELRDTIWAMNNNAILFDELRSRILNFIEKAKFAKENIYFKFNIDENLNEIKLTSIVGMNIYRTIQEAVNNAIKYANSNSIEVDVIKKNNLIKISIKDNGTGFDLSKTDEGNGIRNMRKRIEEIGGNFQLTSTTESGTKIIVQIKV